MINDINELPVQLALPIKEFEKVIQAFRFKTTTPKWMVSSSVNALLDYVDSDMFDRIDEILNLDRNALFYNSVELDEDNQLVVLVGSEKDGGQNLKSVVLVLENGFSIQCIDNPSDEVKMAAEQYFTDQQVPITR